jgi:hypothetical protein
MDANTKTDLEYRMESGQDTWPDADPALIERIARKAQQLAEETEAQGIAEGWAYGACQTSYGCDWAWRDQADEPTARVFDCDGETIVTLSEHEGL